MNAESQRLEEDRNGKGPWKKWGPYLSERQWGTVREDESDNGDAWGYFSHDQARSRAYRWGEDGLAGISDDQQLLCFALALWNGRDPILKERLFGLTNAEGNHGEDVKEYYYYLDSTPTHSYMKYLYKYPQSTYPYDELVANNRNRGRYEMEFELIDTGIFDDNRYFDVFVEYAKRGPEDVLVQITAANRGPDTAELHLLPTLWFRNTWSWSEGAAKPLLTKMNGKGLAVKADHLELGRRYLYFQDEPELLFTENETNTERVFGQPNSTPYVKDGIHNYLVYGQQNTVNPKHRGTKVAAHYRLEIGAGKETTIWLRLTDRSFASTKDRNQDTGFPFGLEFDETLALRRKEADEFYKTLTPQSAGEDEARVLRQALAGMLWSKQYYLYDLTEWLRLRPRTRNQAWFHMVNADVISMPDKWEYPWYAAWDLAFHTVALVLVDPDFAKKQLDLMLRGYYLHPNGQIPAYEWNFSDVNPPVHAWATYYVYQIEKDLIGKGDTRFLEHAFHKLLMNFTWWVNRKDTEGNNVFEGGFLGLDNIGLFDRSAPLPSGVHLEQADGTAWMAFYCQCMLQIALELAQLDPVYQEVASKFFEHFLWINHAMNEIGGGLWDEEDGFFYDVLRSSDGASVPLKVRSMVGLLPLAATTVVPMESLEGLDIFMKRVQWLSRRRPELAADIPTLGIPGVGNRRLLSLLNKEKLQRVLSRMLSEDEFLSPYGLRSLSHIYQDEPYTFSTRQRVFEVRYEPAESSTGMFGGNSNWRGPVWFPVNVLLLRALEHLYSYYGDDFKVECPTGSGRWLNLWQVTAEIANRLTRIFLQDAQGCRPVYGGVTKFQNDPYWRDLILFYEYFHGDNGAGIGASHQTGWTGLVATLIQLYGSLNPEEILGKGIHA
jgi:hypothetical protein